MADESTNSGVFVSWQGGPSDTGLGGNSIALQPGDPSFGAMLTQSWMPTSEYRFRADPDAPEAFPALERMWTSQRGMRVEAEWRAVPLVTCRAGEAG